MTDNFKTEQCTCMRSVWPAEKVFLRLSKARQEIGELLDEDRGTLRNWICRTKGEGITPPTGEPVDAELTWLRRACPI